MPRCITGKLLSIHGSTNIEYYGKLQELSEIAGADFFRTHRAYLVHFKYVEKYDATCVTMKNGTALIAKRIILSL